MKTLIITILLFFTFTSPSFSYLDPGSASILLQAIIGFFVAIGATVGIYWKKFKTLVLKIFTNKKKDN